MRTQNAFQEERDLLSHAFYLTLNWRSYLVQCLGLFGALVLFHLFFEFASESAQREWPRLRYVFLLLGFGVSYCWLSALNTLVVKIVDERMMGHLGVSAGLLHQFIDRHLSTMILLPAVCFAILVVVVFLLMVCAAIGQVPEVGNFLLAVLVVPMFAMGFFGFGVAYLGLFELPALIGGEETTPRQGLAELHLMVRRSFSRLFFRHMLAILSAVLIAVPLCVVSGTSLLLIDVVMKEITPTAIPSAQGGAPPVAAAQGLLQHIFGFGPSFSRMVAYASLYVVLALVFALPVSFLSVAALTVNRAAQETLDEEQRAHLE